MKTTEVKAEPLLLSPKAAAASMGISQRKLWSMTFEDHPGIPYLRCGRLVRYCPDELRKWKQSKMQGGQA